MIKPSQNEEAISLYEFHMDISMFDAHSALRMKTEALIEMDRYLDKAESGNKRMLHCGRRVGLLMKIITLFSKDKTYEIVTKLYGKCSNPAFSSVIRSTRNCV